MPAPASRALRSLPDNLTSRTRIVYRDDVEVRVQDADDSATLVRFEDTQPVREFFSWPGKRNYEGHYWSSTVRRHVVFESLLEKQALLAYDYRADVVALAAQPFALLWPRGTTGHKNHVPDLFLRLSSRGGCVVDVRPADRITDKTAEQFKRTRVLCGELGWGYEVFTGLPEPRGQNLAFLSGYRQRRFSPGDEVETAIVAVFAYSAEGLALRTGVYRAANATGLPSELMLAHVYHLLWTHRLTMDLDAALTRDIVVSAP